MATFLQKYQMAQCCWFHNWCNICTYIVRWSEVSSERKGWIQSAVSTHLHTNHNENEYAIRTRTESAQNTSNTCSDVCDQGLQSQPALLPIKKSSSPWLRFIDVPPHSGRPLPPDPTCPRASLSPRPLLARLGVRVGLGLHVAWLASSQTHTFTCRSTRPHMEAYSRQKEKIGNFLALVLLYHLSQARTERFTEEFELFGNCPAFVAWAWRHTGGNREVIPTFLLLTLVRYRIHTLPESGVRATDLVKWVSRWSWLALVTVSSL